MWELAWFESWFNARRYLGYLARIENFRCYMNGFSYSLLLLLLLIRAVLVIRFEYNLSIRTLGPETFFNHDLYHNAQILVDASNCIFINCDSSLLGSGGIC